MRVAKHPEASTNPPFLRPLGSLPHAQPQSREGLAASKQGFGAGCWQKKGQLIEELSVVVPEIQSTKVKNADPRLVGRELRTNTDSVAGSQGAGEASWRCDREAGLTAHSPRRHQNTAHRALWSACGAKTADWRPCLGAASTAAASSAACERTALSFQDGRDIT